MPLYEYECTACHKHTEKIQKFSDPEITVCPHCGGKLQRVISAPAISFKGGGWYADGYGNAKPKSSENKSSGDKPSGDNGSSAPAAKPASDSTSSSTPAAAPAPAPAAASSDKK
ncbi:MAG: regulatory protein FmdB family [Acidobacteriaceae bacterium]|nr:regulatory protein FmdB family [Acidobacteriaceae bacterium]